MCFYRHRSRPYQQTKNTDKMTNWKQDITEMPCLSMKTICEWVGNDRSMNKGYKFFIEGYADDITTLLEGDNFIIKGLCYRSQAKNEKEHAMEVGLSTVNSAVSSAHCSCKAG